MSTPPKSWLSRINREEEALYQQKRDSLILMLVHQNAIIVDGVYDDNTRTLRDNEGRIIWSRETERLTGTQPSRYDPVTIEKYKNLLAPLNNLLLEFFVKTDSFLLYDSKETSVKNITPSAVHTRAAGSYTKPVVVSGCSAQIPPVISHEFAHMVWDKAIDYETHNLFRRTLNQMIYGSDDGEDEWKPKTLKEKRLRGIYMATLRLKYTLLPPHGNMEKIEKCLENIQERLDKLCLGYLGNKLFQDMCREIRSDMSSNATTKKVDDFSEIVYTYVEYSMRCSLDAIERSRLDQYEESIKPYVPSFIYYPFYSQMLYRYNLESYPSNRQRGEEIFCQQTAYLLHHAGKDIDMAIATAKTPEQLHTRIVKALGEDNPLIRASGPLIEIITKQVIPQIIDYNRTHEYPSQLFGLQSRLPNSAIAR